MPKKHQLISVKEAASRTGIKEDAIRNHIDSGRVDGEKRNYLFWDEWFISDKELAKLKSLDSSDAGNAATARAVETDKVTEHLKAEVESAFSANTFAEAFGAGAAAADDEATALIAAMGEEDSDLFEPTSQDVLVAAATGSLAEMMEANAQYGAHYSDSDYNALALMPMTSDDTATEGNEAWSEYRSKAKTVAEEFLAPLLQRLEIQANMLREKDLLIAEQAKQLRLIPDFQKQREEAHRMAEAKEKEAIQLRQNLTWERKKALIKISAWQIKHVQVEQRMKDTEELLDVLQEQNESEVNYLHCQLTELQTQLAEMHRPWWKKIFRPGQPGC